MKDKDFKKFIRELRSRIKTISTIQVTDPKQDFTIRFKAGAIRKMFNDIIDASLKEDLEG